MRGPDRRAIGIARRLRSNQTDAETVLWKHVRNRQVDGFKFVRQEPIGGYVCDFVCRDRRLVVEVDGGQHNGSAADVVRDECLSAQGYRILRFWNNDVLGNLEGVLSMIQTALVEAAPHPDPLPVKNGARESPLPSGYSRRIYCVSTFACLEETPCRKKPFSR
jgi:very-short-patch-repair endonuclease